MKVLIICSGKTAITWEKFYSSSDYDEMFRSIPDCDIEAVKAERVSSNNRPVYVSSCKSAKQTAELLFTDAEIVEEVLLDEVPQRSCKDTDKKLPLWYWRFMASLQRLLGNNRQSETKSQANARAKKLLDLLESRDQNCILISHPIFIKVLLNRLGKRGYRITRRNFFHIAPLERIVITKWDMHCGGCSHNCLLSNPGCGVGRDAAKRRKG